ncbi:hypothetical protein INT47_005276 [Mucor saturninus]|uniref:Aminoacyl-tRNA synthetase class Ia domain-containing protein n=1 Tax=Mucor saturninus TaxID=64648 RepID=A0A8H7V775_9FUNG|nr:hypothetical protein INT47_005276 [Mucor saturninus]
MWCRLNPQELATKFHVGYKLMGDWDKPYLALKSGYEIRQLRVMTDMIKDKHIYRQFKPVYWSPSSKSALEESELEFNEAHDVEILDEVSGKDLLDCEYQHPLIEQTNPIIGGDHVTAESGTGLVHTAPRHGMEDYEVCLAHNIAPFSPVDDAGRFTSDAGDQLVEKKVFTDGATTVIDMLGSHIILQQAYTHKYPHDWRTKKPVMLRATTQWFANVENLQQKAVNALKKVRMIPEVLPIPALYDQHRNALLTESSVEYIIQILQERATDSIGNTLDTELITHGGTNKKKHPAYGSDVLCYWVANCEYTRDVTIGPPSSVMLKRKEIEGDRTFRVTGE